MTDVVDWAKLIYGIYRDQNPKQGNFLQVPTSPWQDKILGTTYDWMTNGTPSSKLLMPAVGEFGKSSLPHLEMPDYVGPMAGKNPIGNGGISSPTINWDALMERFNSGILKSGPGTSTTTAPTGGGSPSGPSPIPGDTFGHLGAPAGGPGDPFAGWPTGGTGPATEQEKSAFLDFVKKYGPGAVSFAATLIGGNPLLSGKTLYDTVKSWLGMKQPSTLPLKHNDVSPDNLRPAGAAPGGPDQYDMRPPAPVTYTPRDPANMYDPGHGISSGIVQPEGQGHGQGGFGYGWGYDPFYGGGGGGGGEAQLGDETRWRRRGPLPPSVGQRV